MARPTRQGVDYFPLDVHLDNKFKFVEIKFGLEGFAVVIKILQEIYAQGYFCKWGEDEKLLFSNEHNVNFDRLNEISRECLERDIFDKSLYEDHEILTSRGIQARYKEIVRRRKDVDITREYILIDGNFGVNDDTVTTSSKQKDDKSTQSKVKESKVNKSKEKNKEPSVQKYNFEQHHFKLAELLYKQMLKNNSNAKKPNLESWANTFRLMTDRDKREGKEIQDLIIWTQEHDFWCENILSANALRRQYDRLILQMKNERLRVINGNQKSTEVVPDWFNKREKHDQQEQPEQESVDKEEIDAMLKELAEG